MGVTYYLAVATEDIALLEEAISLRLTDAWLHAPSAHTELEKARLQAWLDKLQGWRGAKLPR